MPLPNYNIAPGTQSGSGAYGSVPGIIGLPPNLYSQTAGQFGAVNPAGTNATNFIQAETAGQIAPDQANALQRKAASMGVNAGMPGSDFAGNNFLESLGLESQNLAHQGVQDYLSFITGQGSQMTDPNLAFTVAQQNAVDAAAPNPAAAAGAMLSLARPHNPGGVQPMGFNGPTASITPPPSADTGWNDPGNPAILYGPAGGTQPDMYAGASPYNMMSPDAYMNDMAFQYLNDPLTNSGDFSGSYYGDASGEGSGSLYLSDSAT